MYCEAKIPTEALKDLIAGIRAGAFTSPETVDAGLYSAGCLHALRGPSVFGSEPTGLETCTLDDLADHLEHFASYEPPVESEPEPVQAIDWNMALQIVLLILDRLRKE